jgi:hypothetical protein
MSPIADSNEFQNLSSGFEPAVRRLQDEITKNKLNGHFVESATTIKIQALRDKYLPILLNPDNLNERRSFEILLTAAGLVNSDLFLPKTESTRATSQEINFRGLFKEFKKSAFDLCYIGPRKENDIKKIEDLHELYIGTLLNPENLNGPNEITCRCARIFYRSLLRLAGLEKDRPDLHYPGMFVKGQSLSRWVI